VLNIAKDSGITVNENPTLNMPSELDLVKKLSNFPDVVKTASKERAPYKITNYIHDLAEAIHAFYSECRVIDRSNLEVTSNRLGLCLASKIVMKNALGLVGVSAPSQM